MQHAVNTYEIMDAPDKGSYLKIMHSNSIWKDGELLQEYRQPFDFIAKTNLECKQKMAAFPEKNGHCPIWLPLVDYIRTIFLDPPIELLEFNQFRVVYATGNGDEFNRLRNK